MLTIPSEITTAGRVGSIAVVLAVRDPSMLDAVDSMRREFERYTFRIVALGGSISGIGTHSCQR